jgi:putative transposase
VALITTLCRHTPYFFGIEVREIQSHLEEMSGIEVPPTLFSSVTDAIMDEAKAWQVRPLDAVYSIVYLDSSSPAQIA